MSISYFLSSQGLQHSPESWKYWEIIFWYLFGILEILEILFSLFFCASGNIAQNQNPIPNPYPLLIYIPALAQIARKRPSWDPPSIFVRRRGTWEPSACEGVSGAPKMSQWRPRCPKVCPKTAQGAPKRPQRFPKERQKERNAVPRACLGTPKCVQRSPIYPKTPDQPHQRPLC